MRHAHWSNMLSYRPVYKYLQRHVTFCQRDKNARLLLLRLSNQRLQPNTDKHLVSVTTQHNRSYITCIKSVRSPSDSQEGNKYTNYNDFCESSHFKLLVAGCLEELAFRQSTFLCNPPFSLPPLSLWGVMFSEKWFIGLQTGPPCFSDRKSFLYLKTFPELFISLRHPVFDLIDCSSETLILYLKKKLLKC